MEEHRCISVEARTEQHQRLFATNAVSKDGETDAAAETATTRESLDVSQRDSSTTSTSTTVTPSAGSMREISTRELAYPRYAG